MKNALYITCYNHRAMLERLVASGLLKDIDRTQWDLILFDQSDDQHAASYASFAQAMDAEHVRNVNHGASAAKRAQIQHAFDTGREIMAQISEDFVLAPPGQAKAWWLANGRETFFTDALTVLEKRPRLAFCNWTFARAKESDFWCHQKKCASALTIHKVANLPHVEGDVVAFGWPYTALVREMMKLIIDVRNPKHAEAMQGPDGGEWVLAMHSLGKGASLFAQPVIHDRDPDQRPSNRKP
jgi:hypothetical protein